MEAHRAALAALAFSCLPGCSDEAAPQRGRVAASPARLPEPPDASALDAGWFAEVTAEAGIDFVREAGERGDFVFPEIMGGGAAVLDWNGDGRPDLFLVNGGADSARPGERGDAANALFENAGGGRFARVPDAGGPRGESYGQGATSGDADGDGRADLYLTCYGPDELWLGGDGAFRRAPVDAPGWSCSAAFFDADRDGDLDLYVARYLDYDPAKRCREEADRLDYCGPLEFPAQSDLLLVNDGRGGLADRSERAGIARVAAAGLGVAVDDFDEDGWQDVYVANDAYANNLWINGRDGTFRDEGVLAGAAYNLHGQAEAGMGVVAADLDRDGHCDLFVTHLVQETNTLYRNLGGARGFVDATGRSGLAQASLTLTGFGVLALDVELDGDLDLLVGNGRVKVGDPWEGAVPPPPWDRYAEPNLLHLNDGAGAFELACDRAPRLCGLAEVTRALAAADVDGDGDQDVVLVPVEGPARLFRNDAPRSGLPLVVAAHDGRVSDALGAAVELRAGELTERRRLTAGFGYAGSSEPRVAFALPLDWRGEVLLRVAWTDGALEEFAVADPRALPGGLARLARGSGRELP